MARTVKWVANPKRIVSAAGSSYELRLTASYTGFWAIISLYALRRGTRQQSRRYSGPDFRHQAHRIRRDFHAHDSEGAERHGGCHVADRVAMLGERVHIGDSESGLVREGHFGRLRR